MGGRTFDHILKCGCMYSADAGGGLLPCYHNNPTEEQIKKCKEAHKEWHESQDYQQYEEELEQDAQ